MAFTDSFGGVVGQSASGTLAVASLTSASSGGAGSALDQVVCRANHALVVTSGAGVSAGVVALQGSLDGTNWYNFTGTTSVTTNAANTSFPLLISNQPARFLRANITTPITGGTVTALVASA